MSLVLFACVPSCAPAAKDGGIDVPEGAEVRVYEVYGMDCPGCHGGLTKLVRKLDGVLSTEANWREEELAVVVRPGATLADADVHSAIRRANFTPGKRKK